MRISTRTSIMALAIATAFPFTSAPAMAQAPGDTDTPAADSEEGIADIIVTATRRSENLQDIPLSVATVDDETLGAINSGGADIRGRSRRAPPKRGPRSIRAGPTSAALPAACGASISKAPLAVLSRASIFAASAIP